MAQLIEINKNFSSNSSDATNLRPRAVVAIFPFIVRELTPFITISENPSTEKYKDYLNLRNKIIIIVDDILSLNISTAKSGPNHTLQATLAPLDFSKERKSGLTSTSTSENNIINYLQRIAPGDYVMSWIVNGTDALDELLIKLRDLKPANEYNSGLKFLGQVMNIQETFRVAANGQKTIRFNMSASGFSQYNSQIFYSPFQTKKDASNEAAATFPSTFFENLGGNIVEELYSNKDGGALGIHKQFKNMHKILLGPGPSKISEAQPIRSVNGAFGVPAEVINILGRKSQSSGAEDTFADLCSVILGVQTFDQQKKYGVLGPSFELESSFKHPSGKVYGAYYEPTGGAKDKYFLKGRKGLRISPTMGGTVHSLLQQVSNPTINETYYTLRPEPTEKGDILPTLVCRQLPFITKLTEEIKDFPFTLYFDLPRFMIPKEIIMGYDISRNDALRLNSIMTKPSASVAKPKLQEFLDSLALQFGNWSSDPNDIKRNGMRFYPVQLDQDIIALDAQETETVIRKYTAFLISVINNQHLKYTGSIQTFGIFDPICVGENIEFNNIVFHIENVAHNYQIQGGIPVFRTTLALTHGTHKSGNLEALQIAKNYNEFESMHGGIIKDGKYPTEFHAGNPALASSEGSDLDSSGKSSK